MSSPASPTPAKIWFGTFQLGGCVVHLKSEGKKSGSDEGPMHGHAISCRITGFCGAGPQLAGGAFLNIRVDV